MHHFLVIFGIVTLVVAVLAVRSVVKEVKASKGAAPEDLGSKADDDDLLEQIEDWRRDDDAA